MMTIPRVMYCNKKEQTRVVVVDIVEKCDGYYIRRALRGPVLSSDVSASKLLLLFWSRSFHALVLCTSSIPSQYPQTSTAASSRPRHLISSRLYSPGRHPCKSTLLSIRPSWHGEDTRRRPASLATPTRQMARLSSHSHRQQRLLRHRREHGGGVPSRLRLHRLSLSHRARRASRRSHQHCNTHWWSS
jgi:hypothetical protein